MKKIAIHIGLIVFLLANKSATAQTDSAAMMASISKDSGLYRYGFHNLFVKNGFFSNNIPYDSQLHPMAYSFVKDYLSKHGKYLQRLKTDGITYFMLIDNVLTKYGLPKELKYLAVIESSLDPYQVSWVGATGPWQFMPQTARRYGLVVNSYTDERRNYYRSTHAAARYLTSLYHEFRDWLLVIAAYNGGEARVRSAIKKANSKDFWKLQFYLPEESRNHVKKFIATHYVMEGKGGVTTIGMQDFGVSHEPGIKLTDEELKNSSSERIIGKYHSSVIIRTLGIDNQLFNRLNPDFDKTISSSSEYDLRLPNDKMDIFKTKRNDILNESVDYILNNSSNKKYPELINLPPPKKTKTSP
jgi:membrane-bound lytic murein transglycosylase D